MYGCKIRREITGKVLDLSASFYCLVQLSTLSVPRSESRL